MRIQAGVLVLLAWGSTAGAADAPASWKTLMRGFEKQLEQVYVDVAEDSRHPTSTTLGKLKKDARSFSRSARALQRHAGGTPDGDPSLSMISSLFSQEMENASAALNQGNRTYAKSVLKSATHYCNACHTRSARGVQFQFKNPFPTHSPASAIERAQYYSATRQFDRALAEYKNILESQSSTENLTTEWEQATRGALAISIRVKNDPIQTLEIVEQVLSASSAPFYLKEQAKQWKESVLQWIKERSNVPLTEEGYSLEALRLIARARARQSYPLDRAADIDYLRASRVLHDQLNLAPTGLKSAEALYLLGISYEVLHSLNLWDMHETYYLACVSQAPHSEQALTCYRRYEESVYAGYTGSAGVHIPREIRASLQKLKMLSKPATINPNQTTRSPLE